ncbi:hypothetical protein CMI37_31765 [Candidatus Pacearchaeota archaeon]|nr:hypothetical protein [Candidatus Pacearchaeota archaeon]
MRQTDRDELLIRLDEKFKRLYGDKDDEGDIPEIKKHQEKQNDGIAEALRGCAVNRNSIKLQWKIIGGSITLCGIVVGLILGLTGRG